MRWWTAYPGDAGIAVPAKGELPCWLEGLEVLVGLEEGTQRKRIHDANGEKHSEDRQATITVGAGGFGCIRGRGSRGLARVAGPDRHIGRRRGQSARDSALPTGKLEEKKRLQVG